MTGALLRNHKRLQTTENMHQRPHNEFSGDKGLEFRAQSLYVALTNVAFVMVMRL
jgi:hypothetical protein